MIVLFGNICFLSTIEVYSNTYPEVIPVACIEDPYDILCRILHLHQKKNLLHIPFSLDCRLHNLHVVLWNVLLGSQIDDVVMLRYYIILVGLFCLV